MSNLILIVDDDETLTIVMSLQAKRFGMSCLIAKDGVESFELFSKTRFALVLMDIQMPAMDGLQATKEMRKFEAEHNRPRTPIVAVTASPTRERCLDAGMDDFLFKPILISDIEKMFDRWIPEQPKQTAKPEHPEQPTTSHSS